MILLEEEQEIWIACKNKLIHVFSIDGKLLHTFTEHTDEVTCLLEVDTTVWSGSLDGYVKLIDKKSRRVLKKIQIKDSKGIVCVGCLCYSIRENSAINKIVWVGGMGFLARYNAKQGTLIDSVEKFNKGVIESMVYVNNQMWCASNDNILFIFDGLSGKLNRVLEGHMGRVFFTCISG